MSKKLVPIEQKYYFSNFENDKTLTKPQWELQLTAKPIALSGYEEIDLFILKSEHDDGVYWNISDGYTGSRLYKSQNPESKADAISNLVVKCVINKMTPDKLKKKINEYVMQFGLSPRYKKQ